MALREPRRRRTASLLADDALRAEAMEEAMAVLKGFDPEIAAMRNVRQENDKSIDEAVRRDAGDLRRLTHDARDSSFKYD